MRKFIDRILRFFTLLAGFFLLLSYLSVYAEPTLFWYLGFIGLLYPFILLINVAFLVYWIARWEWFFLYPALLIIIGLSHFANFFQFPFSKNNLETDSDLKVISYNVNLFHLYSWSKEPPTFNSVYAFLRSESPDIVCLQEFYVDSIQFTENDARQMFKYNAHFGYIVNRPKSGYGMATYSRYPIVDTGELKFDNSANACIFTDILVGNDTLRVYNIHLQSFRLEERNLNFLLSQEYRKESQTMDEIKDISFRFRDALRKRAHQVDKVTEHMFSSPYPVIACGDFNESPISYNYHRMTKQLNDAFVEAGVGVGHTYKGFFPSFRIDYILYNPKFTATSYSSPKIYHSDHFPVVTTLAKKKE
ncbi:MAG: endonuclease/exonuclease/phosphatase family protein [Bacteroidales bacterium]